MTGRRERERNDRATKCVCAERVRTHHNFQRDAVALTAAMLGIADFRKSDPQTIIEATSMLYGCAYNILYRMHAEHTTRNTETCKPATRSVTMAEALDRKELSLSRIGHEH